VCECLGRRLQPSMNASDKNWPHCHVYVPLCTAWRVYRRHRTSTEHGTRSPTAKTQLHVTVSITYLHFTKTHSYQTMKPLHTTIIFHSSIKSYGSTTYLLLSGQVTPPRQTQLIQPPTRGMSSRQRKEQGH